MGNLHDHSLLTKRLDVPLLNIDIPIDTAALPDRATELIRTAESRIREFVRDRPVSVTGFVPSDFSLVYRALQHVSSFNLAPGNSFCEWGSGFGVVTSLAATLGYSAVGIEIEADLVRESKQLAADFELAVEIVHGSFIPSGGEEDADEAFADNDAELFWLVTDADEAYGEIGLEPDDFAIIFAYPWPGEEHVAANLFEQFAADGALLLTYSHLESVRLRRKVR